MTLLNTISLQMFQNKMKISQQYFPLVSLGITGFFWKMFFIYNDKRISDKNMYNEGSFGRSKISFSNEHLIDQKVFDKKPI